IVAAVVLAGGIALSIHTKEEPNSLVEWVDAYQAREEKEDAFARHADVDKKVTELTEATQNPAFAKLAKPKQEYVRHRLRELKAYQEYRAKLDEIRNPKDARSEFEMARIKSGLTMLPAAEEYREDWQDTEAGRRRLEWLNDARALDDAVYELKKSYQ